MRTVGGSAFVLVLAVVLMLGGGVLAWSVRTDFGNVDVERLRFATDDGSIVAARLYRPVEATAATPVAGALLLHGYGDDEGMLTPYAIELVRRGYVVLAVDAPGHGRSAPPIGRQDDFGAHALALVRSLAFVDPDAIVIVGHGSGGEAALAAARADEGNHAAVVLLGAVALAADLDSAALRNVALVAGRFDEFAPAAWRVASAGRAVASDPVRSLFGATEVLVANEIYGSVEEGTGRILYLTPLTHHALLASGSAIAPTLDWAQRAAAPPRPLPPNDQVWIGSSVGSGMVLVGFVLALFGLSGVLLATRAFRELWIRPAPAAGMRGSGWWLAAIVTAAVPAITYFWAFERAEALLGVTSLWPQPLATGAVVWACLNGAVALVVVLGWWLFVGRRRGARSDTLGLHVGGFGRATLFAVLVVTLAHALLGTVERAFGVDARLWILAQGALDGSHATAFALYVVPLVLVFAVLGMLLHGQLRPLESGGEGADAMIANALIAAGGLLVLLAAQYGVLATQERLPFGEPLLSVFAIELAFLAAVAATLSTYLFSRTGSVWPAALLNGAWVAGYLVAGVATHVVA